MMLFTNGRSSYQKDYYLSDKSGNTLLKCIKVYHVKSEPNWEEFEMFLIQSGFLHRDS